MFEDMASGFYRLHYQEAIAPNLTNDQKLAVANRISDLTLKAPIWQDKETNHLPDFPELEGYVNTTLSGLYLCAIFAAIMDDFLNPKDDPAHLDKLGGPEDIELRLKEANGSRARV